MANANFQMGHSDQLSFKLQASVIFVH